MLDVFFEADEDLRTRDGRPPRPRNPEQIAPYLDHLVSTDPETSMVALDRGRMVAFGIIMVREMDGFLSELFVVPRWQRRGIGRAVLDACLRSAAVARMATCSDAVQPVSTGLYASLGLAPRLPLYLLSGPVDLGRLPSLATDVRVRPLEPEDVADLDGPVLGYRRAVDHIAWSRLGRSGWVFVGASGALRGYGYTHPSGRVSPVLAVDPGDLAGFVGSLVRSVPDMERYRCLVPGPATAALRPLLAAGLRIDGSPGIYCANHDGPSFERYLPMSTSLL